MWGGVCCRVGERQGCRMSRAQCEQLRGVISQAGSPHVRVLIGPDRRRRRGPGLLKDTNRWEASSEGAAPDRHRKGRCTGPAVDTTVSTVSEAGRSSSREEQDVEGQFELESLATFRDQKK